MDSLASSALLLLLFIIIIIIIIIIHLFCKQQLTERNCTIITQELVKVQQFKHAITDKLTSTNSINS